MGQFPTRDLIWDICIKRVIIGDHFTATDVVDDANTPLSPQEVTEVLDSLAHFGWVEEQTDREESEWHPRVDLQAHELPDLKVSGQGSNSETKYDPSSSEGSDGDPPETVESSETGNSADGDNDMEGAEGSGSEGSDGDEMDAKTLEGVTTPSDLVQGKVYVATVHRASSNALIDLERGHINLGPISEDVVGEEVRFKPVGGCWGKCLDDEYTYEDYSPRDDGSSSIPSKGRSKGSGKVVSSKVRQKPGTTGGSIGGKDPENKNKLLNGLR